MAGGGGGINWAIGIDMYTLTCIKLMTNNNLLYKKINKIQKLKKKRNFIYFLLHMVLGTRSALAEKLELVCTIDGNVK